jgi:hypothetical protein
MAHLAAHITLTARDVPPLSHLHPGSIHVAIISDGNGRWATSRGLPRSSGHRAGAVAARGVIAAAPRLGVHTLTFFALSSANWQRPANEVRAILNVLHEYLLAETSRCIEESSAAATACPAPCAKPLPIARPPLPRAGACTSAWPLITPRVKPFTSRPAASTKSRNSPSTPLVVFWRKFSVALLRKWIC